MKKIIILAISLFLSFINLYSIDIVEQFTISGNNLKLFKVSSDYKYFYTIDDSNRYCIWDAKTHELLTQKSFTFTYNSIDVSDDGKYVFYDLLSDSVHNDWEGMYYAGWYTYGKYNVNKWNIENDSIYNLLSKTKYTAYLWYKDSILILSYNMTFLNCRIKLLPKSDYLYCSYGIQALYPYTGYHGVSEYYSSGFFYLINTNTNELQDSIFPNKNNYYSKNVSPKDTRGNNMKIIANNKDNSIIIANSFSSCILDYYGYGENYSCYDYDTFIIRNNKVTDSLRFSASYATISPDDNYLATINNDTLRIWTLDSLQKVLEISKFSSSEIIYANNPDYLICSNPLRIINIKKGQTVDSIQLNQTAPGTMLFKTADSLRYLLVDTKGHCTIFNSIYFKNTLASNFVYWDTTGIVPYSVQFNDLSNGKVKSWKWDFGDGEYSTEQNPTHIYKNAGVYSVKLIVTDSLKSDSITKNNIITAIGFKKDIKYSIDTLWALKTGLSTVKPIEYSPDNKLIYTSDYLNNINIYYSKTGLLDTTILLYYYTNLISFSYDKKSYYTGYYKIFGFENILLGSPSIQIPNISTLNSQHYPLKTNIINGIFFKKSDKFLILENVKWADTLKGNIFGGGTAYTRGDFVLADKYPYIKILQNYSISTSSDLPYPAITQLEVSPDEQYYATLNYLSTTLFDSNYIDVSTSTTFGFQIRQHIENVPIDSIDNYILYSTTDTSFANDYISWSNDSKSVYFGTADGTLYHKNLSNPDSDIFDYKYPSQITFMKFTNDGESIITGHSNGDVYIYNLKYKLITNHCNLVSSVIGIDVATDSTQFVVGTKGGYLWCFKLDIPVYVSETNIIQNIKAEVLPNPAYDEATIRYTLNRQSSVQIEIYNNLGERVMKIDEALQTEGRHDCTININNLNSGMYYYRLIADGNVATGVMAVVK